MDLEVDLKLERANYQGDKIVPLRLSGTDRSVSPRLLDGVASCSLLSLSADFVACRCSKC